MKQSIMAIAKRIGDREFSIPHFGDKRVRIYAGDSEMSHMNGKESKYVTEFVAAEQDDEQAFNNIGKYMAKGMDKASNADRIAYATAEYSNMVTDIVEIPAYAAAVRAQGTDAIAPNSYARVAEYDDPMRYIQAAQAIVKSIRDGAANGTVCASDGSCSGLQIFSGIIHDRKTAELVNLTATNVRSDIYIMVADYVKANINTVEALTELMTKKSMEANIDTIDAALIEAASLINNGAVTRNTTKSATMTLTYGSMVQTTIRTVREDLIKVGSIDDSDFGKLVGLIIGLAVEKSRVANAGNAMKAMKFLQNIVKATNAQGEIAIWSTGDGIVLHNEKRLRSRSKTRVYTPSGDMQVNFSDNDGALDTNGMLAAIAPNFVHSFDAKLLQLSVNACAAEGIPMIVIHDSFSTTTNHYVRMNEIIREQFAMLFDGQNHLYGMLQMNRSRMSEEAFEALMIELDDVVTGDYDVNEIINNEFAFA